MHGVSYDRPMITYLTSPFKLPKLIKEWTEVPTLKFCCTKVKDSQVYSSLLNFIHLEHSLYSYQKQTIKILTHFLLRLKTWCNVIVVECLIIAIIYPSFCSCYVLKTCVDHNVLNYRCKRSGHFDFLYHASPIMTVMFCVYLFRTLPPQFPNERPLVKVAPPLVHPWVNDQVGFIIH